LQSFIGIECVGCGWLTDWLVGWLVDFLDLIILKEKIQFHNYFFKNQDICKVL